MLEEYVRKRKFSRTPEPAPLPDEASNRPARDRAVFCVQRHHATRLHYDFRLEVDGVLKSWAMPKGPSLEPRVRHLAVRVEDHPLEYGSFEGNIPAGEYGAGSVMLWDRGTYELLDRDVSATEQLARGDFKFRLWGEKLRGEFALVLMKGRGKGNEWLLIKKRDEFATAGWDVEDYAWSVISGRTQEEIAQNLPAREAKRQAAGNPERVWQSKRPAARSPKPLPKAAVPPGGKRANFDPSGLKGARAAPLPEWFEPMSAGIAVQPPAGEDWLFEVKWDGVRALCFLDGEELCIYSRSGRRTERQYPELSVLPHFVAARQAVLDGEITVLDAKGVSRFELIQPRIANTDPAAVAHLAHSTPVVLFLFDILYLDGYDLRDVALLDRRRALEAVLTPSPVIRLSEAFPGAGEELLAAARENGLEGILAKHASSRYASRRSREWLKLKLVNEQEFVICGFTAGERDHLGALVLGLYEDGQLVWAGNVGTGFTLQGLRDLRARLDALISKHSPFEAGSRPPTRDVTWVRPELVAMIKFSNWTPGKHLRAPVFLGLRDDVLPLAVRRESSSPLLSGTANEASLTIDGHRLRLTNLNKVLFPEDHYTKRDLLNYYDAVAHLILPHLKDRPLSLKRYPNGIDAEFFFQKDMPANQGSWLRKVKIWSEHGHSEHGHSEHGQGPTNYVFADDRASLLYLTNLACVDQNPWMSRVNSIDSPDFVLIDLDPFECGYDKIVEAALLVRKVLDSIGLIGYPKTTGGDGMHIYIPLEPVYTYEDSRTFAELLARLVIAERPELFTMPRSVSHRERDRVYFDYLQNGKSKTVAAPYSARAYPHAPVSTPLDWHEVKKGLRPAQFTMRNAPDRFARTGDLFEGVLKKPQTIEAALERLEKLARPG
jgi:bifunctional non-homologous end joining protein LigD